MKRMKQKFILIMAFAATLFSACDREAEIVETPSIPVTVSPIDDNLIRVFVDDGMTRAGYTTENLEEFGLFVYTPGQPDHTYKNVRMIKGEDGEWKPENGLIMQWWDKTSSVDIIAYAPYKEGVEYTTSSQVPVKVEKDQSSEDNLMASDFIVMKWEGFLPSRDEKAGMIPVKFKHLMSRMKLTVTYVKEYVIEEGVSPIKEVIIGNDRLHLEGICDFSQPSPTVSKSNTAPINITPFRTGEDLDQLVATYECMIMPQSSPYWTIRVNFTDGTSTIYLPDRPFESGHSYNYRLAGKKIY